MVYECQDLQIDEDAFELRRAGATVKVEPRVFDFILYLIRNRTRVVTKDELLEKVWSQTCVVESVLARCACIARKALGDPLLIRTVHGRGYRWMERTDGAPKDSAARTTIKAS